MQSKSKYFFAVISSIMTLKTGGAPIYEEPKLSEPVVQIEEVISDDFHVPKSMEEVDYYIRLYAELIGISLAEARALVHKESSGNCSAVGDNGRSIGCTQINTTVKAHQDRCNFTEATKYKLKKPDVGIPCGFEYYKLMQERLKKRGITPTFRRTYYSYRGWRVNDDGSTPPKLIPNWKTIVGKDGKKKRIKVWVDPEEQFVQLVKQYSRKG